MNLGPTTRTFREKHTGVYRFKVFTYAMHMYFAGKYPYVRFDPDAEGFTPVILLHLRPTGRESTF